VVSIGEVRRHRMDVQRTLLIFLKTIVETAMGINLQAQEQYQSDYINSVKEMCRITIERSFSAIQNNTFLYKFTANYKEQCRCLKILHDHTKSVIRNRKIELSRTQQPTVIEDEIGSRKKLAFLDLLLKSTIDGKYLTDEDIREEVDTFMFEVNLIQRSPSVNQC
jgi:cytochrome P450 family 4